MRKAAARVASGPVKFNGTSIQDTWTKQTGAKSEPSSRPQSSALFNGLK